MCTQDLLSVHCKEEKRERVQKLTDVFWFLFWILLQA